VHWTIRQQDANAAKFNEYTEESSMPDTVIRKETTHIDEMTRTASASTQWFVEKRNVKGMATHPITHNNKLQFFICGEEGFAAIARDIQNAKESIDLVCWGFDPGMELVRDGGTWPRGDTYGDLLIAAGKRGVKVRLLVWYDPIGSIATKNLPNYTYGDWSRASSAPGKAEEVSARVSIESATTYWSATHPGLTAAQNRKFKETMKPHIPQIARKEYCINWFTAAFDGNLTNIEIRRRGGSRPDIERSLQSEAHQPGNLSAMELESLGMKFLGTHHQKPVLIDYAADNGSKAVGYVMGLNSVTDYWDTCKHELEDTKREQGAELSAGESLQQPRCAHLSACNQASKCMRLDECMHIKDAAQAEVGATRKPGFRAGFVSMKPYQDYACRIEAGQSLICLYTNFMDAWDRAGKQVGVRAPKQATSKSGTVRAAIPSGLLRKGRAGDSSVQIVRTQPEDNDKTIKEIYTLAASKAALACGYMYIENQYFQCEEWTNHLMTMRKQVVAAWKAGSATAGKSTRDMPIMHVFIVIPLPEREQMVPRTYDALAVLGQQDTMTGQQALIDHLNNTSGPMFDAMGNPTGTDAAQSTVVAHANTISKPDIAMLENTFGMKVSVAMLQTCGIDQDRWRYREIYIHSKLLLVDDSFLTLGSANLNQRSMAVDSEINMATDNPRLVRDLRKRVFSQLSGSEINGGKGAGTDISDAFDDWQKLMKDNRTRKYSTSQTREKRKLIGFLLPLEDNRSSTMRLG
jgi:phosphatidylserine/phosphatidylglycerophosphate/cardiolipin synthase-like enzyme